MAYQSQPHIVRTGPFAVMGDGGNHASGKSLARQRFEDLRFRQVRVVENDGEDLGMAFRKQRTGNARGTAARQSNFLPEGKLRQARSQLFFGMELELGGSAGLQSELDQIH